MTCPGRSHPTTRPKVSSRGVKHARAKKSRLVVLQQKRSTLAWETWVTGRRHGEPTRLAVYVGARSGKYLTAKEHVLSGTGNGNWEGSGLSIPTTGSGSSFSMTNSNASTLKCQNASGNATFTGTDDAWGNGNATDRETGCVDAFYSAEQMRLMMSSWPGRNGMNGSGGWVPPSLPQERPSPGNRWRPLRRVLHSAVMEITRVDPADVAAVEAYVAVRNAVSALDAPWLHPFTPRSMIGYLRYGWDGEPDLTFLGTEDGVAVASGTLSTTEYDNLHLAWVGTKVHPDHRRRGLGTEMLEAMLALARKKGRTSVGIDAWDAEGPKVFAARHGFEPKSVAINRRQILADVDFAELRARYDEALPFAAEYELVRRAGATPDHDLEAVAEMSASINDAPTDDLDIEDEVFPPERIRAYEVAQEACGRRLYRVLARHRGTGALAGHSVLVVDAERPELGDQHDTSVVGAHRGHRLGLLLKADMNLWLREVEPQLVSIDTWNAESNAHMIGVNELLGYTILGRQLEFQKSV